MAQGLCELGANINPMRSTLYENMGMGSRWPTTIIFQLAYKSLARPEGIMEDELI